MYYLGFLLAVSAFTVITIARPLPFPFPQSDLTADDETYSPEATVSNNVNLSLESEPFLLANDNTGDGKFIFHSVNITVSSRVIAFKECIEMVQLAKFCVYRGRRTGR